MRKFISLTLIASLPILQLGCSSSSDKNNAGNGGGDGTGESAGADDGGSSAAGRGNSAGGKSGAPAVGNGDAGEAGTGGTGGTGATGEVSGSGNSNGGQAGNASVPLGQQILGPVMDDETPTVVTVTTGTSIVVSSGGMSYAPEVYSGLIKDKSGNVYVIIKPGFLKYNSHLVKQWQFYDDGALGSPVRGLEINYLSIATDGSVFYSGNRVGTGGVAGKISPAGTLAWENVVGAGASDSTSCAVTPDGGVMFAGDSSGQVTGNPPDVAGGPWLARYGSDGTKAWLKQYNKQYSGAVGAVGASSLSVDPSGNVYLLAQDALKVSASGDIISFVPHDESPTNQPGGRSFNPASMTSAGDAFYVSSSSATGATVLSKYDTSLKRLVDMQFEPARMKVIDPVEGVTWTGKLGSALYVDATSPGTIYLADGYSNTYENGAVPRLATYPLYVGRYRADGSRVWFKEFVTETPVAGKTESGSVFGIVSDDTTNSIVVASFGVDPHSFLFKLNNADGTVIQSP